MLKRGIALNCFNGKNSKRLQNRYAIIRKKGAGVSVCEMCLNAFSSKFLSPVSLGILIVIY